MLQETKDAIKKFECANSYIPTDVAIPKYNLCGKKLYFVNKKLKALTAMIPLEFTLVSYHHGVLGYFQWIVTIKTPNGIECMFINDCDIYESIDSYYNENSPKFSLLEEKRFFTEFKNNNIEFTHSSGKFYLYGWHCAKGSSKASKETKRINSICYDKNGLHISFIEDVNVKLFDTEREALRYGKVTLINDFEDNETETETENEYMFEVSFNMKSKTIEDAKKNLKEIFVGKEIIDIQYRKRQ